MTTAASVLRQLLEMSGLSQAELARRAGMGRSLVSDYVRGVKEPGLSQLQRMAGAAGLDAQVVLSSRIAHAAERLELVCAIAMELPRRDPGPLLFPPFRTLVR